LVCHKHFAIPVSHFLISRLQRHTMIQFHHHLNGHFVLVLEVSHYMLGPIANVVVS
jgi:hypothetical protein